MKHSKPLTLWALGALLLVLSYLLVSTASDQSRWENPLSLFGTRDFIAFWGGIQVIARGKNPYQAEEVLKVQQEVYPNYTEAQVFLNPPFAIPLFYPLLRWSFSVSYLLWMLVNVSALFGSVFILLKAMDAGRRTRIFSFVGTLLFLPALYCLWMGQLSILMLYFFMIGWNFWQKKRFLLSGAFFALLGLKPHLVLVVGMAFVVETLRHRRFSAALGFLSTLVFLALSAELLLPNAFQRWRAMDFDPLLYRTSSLSTFIRLVLLDVDGSAAFWPIPVVALLAMTVVAFWQIRFQPRLRWDGALSGYMVLSLLCAPYVWFYDYVLLLPVQTVMLCWASSGKSGQIDREELRGIYSMLFIYLVLMCSSFITKSLEAYIVFPLLMGLFWQGKRKRSVVAGENNSKESGSS